MGLRGLLEPPFSRRLLEQDLLAANVDELLGVEGAELGGIGQPLPGRGARMQNVEGSTEAPREAEGRLAAGLSRSLLADGQKNPDELHAQGVDSSQPLRLRI